MKRSAAIYIGCLFIFSSCVSTYFKTPNDLYKEHATIYLNDSTVKTGELTIQFETGFESDNYVTLYHRDNKQTEKIPEKNISYYTINESYYFPKEVDLNLNGTYYFLFVKRLTAENSRIQLYELQERYKSTGSGEDQKLYFISLPTSSRYEAFSIYSKQLFPNFDSK